MEYKTVVQRVRKIVRLLSRTGDEVDDISQEALIKLFKNKRPGDIGNKWLYGVVRSCYIDAYRKRKREAKYINQDYFIDSSGMVCESDGDENDNVIPHPTIYYRLISEDCLMIVDHVLDELPPALQQVLLLAAQGYTYPEISKISGAKIGTVRSRLNRARKLARDILDNM